MPGIIFKPASRRNFLKSTSAAFLGFSLAKSTLAQGKENADTLRLALLSDTHIPADPMEAYRGFQPAANLKRIVPEVQEWNSAAVLINGDAARLSGLLEDYQKLKETLAPLAEKTPIIVGMGNHDDRENFAKVFPASKLKKEVPNKQVLVMDEPLLRVIVLDSLLFVNKTPGHLGRSQREWLKTFLYQSDDKPVVIFVHHTLGEFDGELMDADKFLGIVQPARKVKAVFYGHSHVYHQQIREGLHLVNLPAVGYNFNDKEPVGWVQSEFRKDGVGLTLRAFGGNKEGDGKKISLAWRA